MTTSRRQSNTKLRVLILEHDLRDAELAVLTLQHEGFEVTSELATTEWEFRNRLRSGDFDVILADYRLPTWTGMDALTVVKEDGRDIPLILVTGTLGDERAVECVKEGAADYIIKNNLGRLPLAVRRALDEKEARAAQIRATQQIRKLSLAVDQSPASVLMTTTDGVIEYVNRTFERNTGYSAHEAIGQTPRLLRSGQNPPALYHELWATIRNGRVWRGELVNRRKNGEFYWDAVSISPMYDDAGTITNYLAVQQDITERRDTEAMLRQAQKMEAVGRLAGGVAHDFNNLLTVITSYTTMLLDDLNELDPRRDDLEQVRKAAGEAASLTRQLLAFSRQQVIQPRLVYLEDVVRGAEKMLRRVILEDVQLTTVLNPTPSPILIDAGQLEQVIMNLAVNARDAMPHGGHLTIETSIAELDETDARTHWPITPGRFAMLAVSDTGAGMDEATQARIFEPFFTTKELGKGTGLGLATVYGIVKQSGGFIWLYSEPDRGTTFKIYFPLAENAETVETATGAVAPVQSGTETVLLVEDSAAVRHATQTMLQRYGYSVIPAANADEAVAALGKHGTPVHLLLTDVVMPGKNGRQLAEELTREHPELRVLYMSGYTDESVVRRGLFASELAYIQKPFSPEALARKVREVLDAPIPVTPKPA